MQIYDSEKMQTVWDYYLHTMGTAADAVSLQPRK